MKFQIFQKLPVIALLVSCLLIAKNGHAEDLTLKCNVTGSTDGLKMDPAEIYVKVNTINNELFIDIDGPTGYSMGVSSVSFEKDGYISRGKRIPKENFFVIEQSALNTINGRKVEYMLSINRVTGLISVTQNFQNPNSFVMYSGNCTKSKSIKKF